MFVCADLGVISAPEGHSAVSFLPVVAEIWHLRSGSVCSLFFFLFFERGHIYGVLRKTCD